VNRHCTVAGEGGERDGGFSDSCIHSTDVLSSCCGFYHPTVVSITLRWFPSLCCGFYHPTVVSITLRWFSSLYGGFHHSTVVFITIRWFPSLYGGSYHPAVVSIILQWFPSSYGGFHHSTVVSIVSIILRWFSSPYGGFVSSCRGLYYLVLVSIIPRWFLRFPPSYGGFCGFVSSCGGFCGFHHPTVVSAVLYHLCGFHHSTVVAAVLYHLVVVSVVSIIPRWLLCHRLAAASSTFFQCHLWCRLRYIPPVPSPVPSLVHSCSVVSSLSPVSSL
jgi:hypothetical protein